MYAVYGATRKSLEAAQFNMFVADRLHLFVVHFIVDVKFMVFPNAFFLLRLLKKNERTQMLLLQFVLLDKTGL